LAKYDYPHIVTWGHSLTSFVVVTGDVSKHKKVYFNTDQVPCGFGFEISNVLVAI
jgi:hypothetical protein